MVMVCGTDGFVETWAGMCVCERAVCIFTITMAVSDQPYIYEVKRHSIERHPLFYFMSFTNPCSPLTAIVIVHIFYVNETTPPPIQDFPKPLFVPVVAAIKGQIKRAVGCTAPEFTKALNEDPEVFLYYCSC